MPQTLRMPTLLGLLLAALVATLVPSSPAEAHYKKTDALTYVSEFLCTQGVDEISHGRDGLGFVRSWTHAKTRTNFGPGGTAACSRSTSMAPGYIALKTHILKWDSRAGRWGICLWHDEWQFNRSWASGLGFNQDLNLVAACGNGFYGTQAGHYLKMNSEWWGGWLWSGYHYLPA